MEPKRIKGTDENPEVILDKSTNEFSFGGKSLPEDVKEFYNPIHDWIEEYVKNPNPQTIVKFKMDYFNSASSKQILDILEAFAKVKDLGKEISIKWYYFEDDEDMEDSGEGYSEMIDIPFEFISYA